MNTSPDTPSFATITKAPNYFTGEDAFQAYWRTLMTDCVAYPTALLDTLQITKYSEISWDLQARQAKMPKAPGGWDKYDGDKDLLYEIGCVAENLGTNDIIRFAVTESGFYCVIPTNAAAGRYGQCQSPACPAFRRRELGWYREIQVYWHSVCPQIYGRPGSVVDARRKIARKELYSCMSGKLGPGSTGRNVETLDPAYRTSHYQNMHSTQCVGFRTFCNVTPKCVTTKAPEFCDHVM